MTRVLLNPNGTVAFRNGVVQVIPENAGPSECVCCGEAVCACSCYDPDNPDPSCNSPVELRRGMPGFTVADVADTYTARHRWVREQTDELLIPGLPSCGCYRYNTEIEYTLNVSGLSALNGGYPAYLHRLSDFSAPAFSGIVGPCEGFGVPKSISELTRSGCGDCSVNPINQCGWSIFVQTVPITATLTHTSVSVIVRDDTTCGDPTTTLTNFSYSASYAGYAYVKSGAGVPGLLRPSGGYPIQIGFQLEQTSGDVLFGGNAEHIGLAKITSGSPSCTALGDPGFTSGMIISPFNSWFLGQAEGNASGAPYNPLCHPWNYLIGYIEEFNDCDTSPISLDHGSVDCPAEYYADYRTTSPTPPLATCEEDLYEEYEYEVSRFRANFSSTVF